MGDLIKRSFSLAGHRTSVALEAEFWAVLADVAHSRGVALSGLVAALDAERGAATPLASALRVLALREAPRLGLPDAESSRDISTR
jgi:predicted DNA-binding ribbon-helix-helix protein